MIDSLRSFENTGLILPKSNSDNSFSNPRKAKLYGAEFFSYTQIDFENLEESLKNELKIKFKIG